MSAERLVSAAAQNARLRLEIFVNEAQRECAAFGTHLDWSAAAWDVTAHCGPLASKARRSAVLYFTTHENRTARGIAGRVAMSEPFASFIKAVVRRKRDASSLTFAPLARLANAARDLHDVLADRGYDPVALTAADFDEAARRAEYRSQMSTAYRLGQSLEQISEVIDRHSLSKTRLDWKTPIRKAHNRHSRTSSGAERAAKAKLPSPEALEALAEISHLVTDPGDVILMSCIKLLHCAPWRISEVLLLPDDCEVEEQKTGPEGPAFDRNGPIVRYGIRYWKAKSPDADVKWIPTVMVDVARKAVADIRAHTDEARRLALWMENNPGRARLPDHTQHPDRTYTTAEVAQILGMRNYISGASWLKRHGLGVMVDGRHLARHAEIEKGLLRESEKQPHDRRQLPLSKHLFLTFRHAHHAKMGANPCALALIKDQHIADFLGGRHATSSIFAKFDRHMPDGSPIRMNSHMFRHWLNTLAQAGGLDQALVARWSGRDDTGQNADYDHVSGIELAQRFRGMMEEGRVIGPLANLHTAKPPADRARFRETVLATAHVTEIGMCDLDWITSTCPEYHACQTCEFCLVVKGDIDARRRTAELRDENAWLLDRTTEEIDDGTIGASNHAASQRRTIEALDRILAIHDDPDIADGTLVQPNATSPDHFGGPALPEPA